MRSPRTLCRIWIEAQDGLLLCGPLLIAPRSIQVVGDHGSSRICGPIGRRNARSHPPRGVLPARRNGRRLSLELLQVGRVPGNPVRLHSQITWNSTSHQVVCILWRQHNLETEVGLDLCPLAALSVVPMRWPKLLFELACALVCREAHEALNPSRGLARSWDAAERQLLDVAALSCLCAPLVACDAFDDKAPRLALHRQLLCCFRRAATFHLLGVALYAIRRHAVLAAPAIGPVL